MRFTKMGFSRKEFFTPSVEEVHFPYKRIKIRNAVELNSGIQKPVKNNGNSTGIVFIIDSEVYEREC